MKLKRYNKLLSILVTMSMLLVLLVPLATPAAASSDYSVIKASAVDDGAVASLGKVLVHLPAGSLDVGNAVTFRLPGDFIFTTAAIGANQSTAETAVQTTAEWNTFVNGVSPDADTYGVLTDNYIEVPEKVGGDNNGLWTGAGSNLTFTKLSNREVKMEVANAPSPGDDCWFYLYVQKAFVADGYSGEITLTFTAPSGSGFTTGSVSLGTVSGGEVTVTVSSVDSWSDSDVVKIRITEDRQGALESKKDSLKFRVPNGFKWSGLPAAGDFTEIWGDGALLAAAIQAGDSLSSSGDEYKIDLTGFTTASATCIEIALTVDVDDETDAKTGDVMMRISGQSDVTPSEIKIGNYGTYDTKIECTDAPEVYAGKLEQVIGDIVITESVAKSITTGRTVTLQLPAFAKWGAMDTDSDYGLGTTLTSFPGTDGRTVKFTFTGESTKAATLELSEMEVALEPGCSGDLTVKVGGTAGLTGELTVAKIVNPVTATASAAPEVRIGSVGEVGDVTITEAAAGVIADGKTIILDLPQGVRFASAPKVEVTEGDLKIDTDSVKTQKDGEEDDNQVYMLVDNDSSVASTIKISGIKYICDRTVPEGDIVLKVKGTAVADVNDPTEVTDYYAIVGGEVSVDGTHAFDVATTGDDTNKVFPKVGTVAKAVNGKVVTPASSEYSATVTFVIGDTKFKVNGIEQTMDVAPYINNDRTYLPVRYVAQALGVADSNIMWNAIDQSVVIIKGDRIIKLVIGSTTMLINGVPFSMDVAPEIVDPGRTMLPLRWVAQALGADVQWDAATQTVTVITK